MRVTEGDLGEKIKRKHEPQPSSHVDLGYVDEHATQWVKSNNEQHDHVHNHTMFHYQNCRKSFDIQTVSWLVRAELCFDPRCLPAARTFCSAEHDPSSILRHRTCIHTCMQIAQRNILGSKWSHKIYRQARHLENAWLKTNHISPAWPCPMVAGCVAWSCEWASPCFSSFSSAFFAFDGMLGCCYLAGGTPKCANDERGRLFEEIS